MGVGKTTAKVYVEKSTGVTFKDVAGQEEAKESLQEVVDFLHNPRKYTDIGAKLPKGALLVGPPGTGKTLLAKAVAGEAKVPFFSLAGSDFVEMFVGVGASRVRDLFKEAQKQAPCIIFIDEIDAIGKSRDTRYGGNDEREQTLNQLLAEMDGFDTSKGLLILAATNRPEVLDKALLRPGRFDRRIIVDKPDLKGRVETLKVHAKNVLLDDSVDLDAIALATSGAVGSDLANMINEAAINAVKHGRKYVNQGDLFESVEVVIAGKEKKDRIMGPKEKKMVAYHEVGHALVTALQKDAEPVQKITIVPRTMGALGYTMQVPEEEKFLMTKNELIAHLVTYMGGRAAEEIVFDSVTTGASNDIEQATKMARAMVTQYGMSDKFGLMGLVTIENQYLDGRASLNCGEETAAQIDQEVMRILKESYDEAVRLLQENRSILDKISEYLYEHETITGKEFMKIFRELKGLPEPEEKTEAQKAAEGFRAEEVHSQEPAGSKAQSQGSTGSPIQSQGSTGSPIQSQGPTGSQIHSQEFKAQVQSQEPAGSQVQSQEFKTPQIHSQELRKPKVQVQEEEILVNTFEAGDLPIELAEDDPVSGMEAEEEGFLEVNTLEGEAIPKKLADLQAAEEFPMDSASQRKEKRNPAMPELKLEKTPVPAEGKVRLAPIPAEGRKEPVPGLVERKAERPYVSAEGKSERVPVQTEGKAERVYASAEGKSERVPVQTEGKAERPYVSAEGKAEQAPKIPDLGERIEIIPEIVNGPAPAAKKVSALEQKKAVEKTATPEELGFFPAKKGSGKRAKAVPAKPEPVKREESRQETPKVVRLPKSGGEDEGEDYLDQLLKELK